MFKSSSPIFIEDSNIPVYLSYIAPFKISAITFFFVVFCRGKISNKTRRHETIHYQLFLETFFIGFLIIYAIDFVIGLIRYKSFYMAYRMISLEQEAYMYDDVKNYLQIRKRYEWLKFRP